MRHPLLALTLAALQTAPFAGAADGGAEILRDPWGIPHVFADTDEGAFFGLGYATAEDRAFQMTYSLRIVQGRLAEVIGEVRQVNRRDTSVDHDRRMRTFGFHRAAQRTAASLDAGTRGLLQAYSDGVNTWFREHRDDLHPLFAQLGLEPEPWTPADCLASWWHLAQFFATDGTRDLIAGRGPSAGRTPAPGGRGRAPARGGPDRTPAPDAAAGPAPLPPDDAPAVVRRGDVSAEWIERVFGYAREHGLGDADAAGGEGPRFSHAWVVGGDRTTTGAAVLVSDPQTPVRNPSLLYQFHVQGRTFNARGAGVAGSPILLVGFTDRVAWGATALGADQADLFGLETDPDHPDRYRFDGQWRPMTLRREVIRVKGKDPVEMTVRETHLGPVATAFCFAAPGEPEVALKRIPTCETDRETIQGAVAMMRAGNVREFDAALAAWRFPSANMVFGDRDGSIGYRAVGAFPVRSRQDPAHGRCAQPGHHPDQDWQEILPPDLAPGVIDPAAGCLYSANHRPIGSWYPLPLGALTGTAGDTQRSWRLRERLEARASFTPEEVLEIHSDAVNPARRDIVRLGLHLRDAPGSALPDEARRALERLEPWYRAGASTALTEPGAELALELNTFFRGTDLARVYGGGESGLVYFLKTATGRLDRDPQAGLSPSEQDFISGSLSTAWQAAQQKYGPDPDAWNAQAREAVRERRLEYCESLDGFPGLSPSLGVTLPALTRIDTGTIGCQTAQAYTQWVPLHDPDLALAVLPIGQSERPDRPSRTGALALWGESRLHPAPLSRAAVERLAVSPARRVEPVPAGDPGDGEGAEVWLCAGDRIMELLEPGAEWPFGRQRLAGIKLYIGQLAAGRRRSPEEAVERLRPLVRLVRAHGLQVAVELGGCLDFSPMDDTAGEWSARHELAALGNFYAAGGQVDFLDLDGPVRRLLHPQNRRDGRRFESIDEAAGELVDALELHRAAHPETRYWLLTNFPNWGWRGEVSYHARGPERQDYGDYDRVVRTVLEKLRAAGIPLDGVTVDNPYDYLTGEHFSVNLPDPKAVDWTARVRSYEDFARDQGLTFNSQRGGQESDERFLVETLQMVDLYRRAGGRPSRWFVQSWYPHPEQMLPGTGPHSMSALVNAVIDRIRGEGTGL
jgi:penicillin amidase